MALREELEQQGTQFFRWRSYWPLLLAGFFVLAFSESYHPDQDLSWNRPWEWLCFSISLLGLGIRAYTTSSAPRGTSGRNALEQRAKSLNTTGMYSVSRHPLYVGNLFIWIGVVLLARSFWFLIVAVLVFWIYYERIMFAEEEFLRREFGDTYLRWATTTPAFLPALDHWKRPELPFSWRNALRREHSGLFAVISAFAASDMLSESMMKRRLTMDWMWGLLFVLGAGVYLALVLLKKKTRVLDVEGR